MKHVFASFLATLLLFAGPAQAQTGPDPVRLFRDNVFSHANPLAAP